MSTTTYNTSNHNHSNNSNIKGIISAVPVFVLVSIVLPYALQYFRPSVEKFIRLPPSQQLWAVFFLFGVIFAVFEFLLNAYVKGDYPWLVGKIGNGICSLAFLSYIFLGMIGSDSLGSEGVGADGLLLLIYASIGLSYLYLFLDFYDARSSKPKPVETQEESPSH